MIQVLTGWFRNSSCRNSVPQFKVFDHEDNPVYVIHPKTCCGGVCIDCCNEGHPCPHGCCIIPFRIYDANTTNTNGDAPYIGKMAKIPKETFCDTYNEVSYVELTFPEKATTDQKGLLLGSFVLINALFFEGSE